MHVPRPRFLSTINANYMRGVVAAPEDGRVVIRDDIPVPKERPGHTRMRVLAAGLNRADLLQAAGKYSPPPGVTPVLGLECAGILPNGNYACGLVSGGAFAEECLVPTRSILEMPTLNSNDNNSNDTLATGLAAIPEAFLVAYHLLFQLGNLGNLAPNSALVLNAAGSGIGTAVVQLAKAIVPDVKVIASARSPAKQKFVSSVLGADVVVDPTLSATELSTAVLEHTNGRGADVLLDCVGADTFRENARSIRVDGKWILYGLLSGAKSKDINLASLLVRRIQLITTTLRSRDDEFKARLVREFQNAGCIDMFREGKLNPIVSKVFDGLEETQDALEYMKANENVGKIVIRVASHP